MKDDLPGDVERFLVKHIDATDQLEVLLLLARQPERDWTAEAVFSIVKTNLDSIVSRLQEFCAKGFLTATTATPRTYRFTPQLPEWADLLQRLDAIYRQRMHRVIEVIYTKPTPTAAQSFADAFRLRKD